MSGDFESVGKAANKAFGSAATSALSSNMAAIRRASAELAASMATERVGREAEINQRRNIITMAEREVDLARQKGTSDLTSLGYLRAATAEITKQKSALAGGGALTQIVDAIKLRLTGLSGIGGLDNAALLRAYEPVGKQLEEAAGAIEEKFGAAASAVGVVVAAVVGLGAVALGVTHNMMELAESIENTASATGLSSTQVQEYNELAKEMGVDSQALQMSFARIQTQLGEFVTTGAAAGSGSQYFIRVMKEMGIALTNAQHELRPTNDILSDFADALAKIPDQGTRTAIEMAAFGTRGRALAQVLEEATRQGVSLRDALKSIDESGNVIPGSELEDLAEAEASWRKLEGAIRGVTTELKGFIAESVLHPGAFLKGMAEQLSGANPAGVAMEVGLAGSKGGTSTGGSSAAVLAVGQAAQLNEKLQQRIEILRAGGETQLQLQQAEKAYAAAVASHNSALATEYKEQIADLRTILSLEAERKHKKPFGQEDAMRAERAQNEQYRRRVEQAKAAGRELEQVDNEIFRNEAEGARRAFEEREQDARGALRLAEEQAEAARKRQEQDEKIAAFSVTGSYGGANSRQLDNLKQIREALQQAGQSTLLVDAAIAKAGDEAVQKWDRAADSIGTMNERLRAFANEVSSTGDNTTGKFFATFKNGVSDLSSTLAKAAVTGKASFADMFASIAEELIKAEIQWSISKLFKPFAGGAGNPGGGSTSSTLSGSPFAFLFGGSGGGAGRTDGTSTSPFYSVITDSAGTPFDESNPLSIVPSASSIAGAAGSAGTGGISSLLGGFGSLIGLLPGFAEGGRPMPGGLSIVGENGPELFIPDRSGTVMPLASGRGGSGDSHFHYEQHVHTPDADSFRSSESQRNADLMTRMSQAHYRNRR